MKKITGIYRISSPIGSVYIGASRNILQRFNQHKNKAITKHRLLRDSLDQYGVKNHKFEIIYVLPHDVLDKVLFDYEELHINQYKEFGITLLNLREGGIGGKHSEETIAKMKGNNGKHMIGRKLSAESIAKRTAKLKGMKRSEEARRNLSLSKMGAKNPMFGKHTNNK